MNDANAFCDVSTRPANNFWAGWLAGWLIACSHVQSCLCVRACAQQCIGEPVLEPHLISVISLISDGTGTRTKDQERNTALCAHPLRLSP